MIKYISHNLVLQHVGMMEISMQHKLEIETIETDAFPLYLISHVFSTLK